MFSAWKILFNLNNATKILDMHLFYIYIYMIDWFTFILTHDYVFGMPMGWDFSGIHPIPIKITSR